jgi:hypothetical protein
VIAVEQPKGGVLKTAIALSEAAAEAGADVLTAGHRPPPMDPDGSGMPGRRLTSRRAPN